MAKNEFDFDFDYEKEYGFDPKAFLDEDEYAQDIDLSEFSDEELGLTPAPAEPEITDEEDDFAVDVDLDEFMNLGDEAELEDDDFLGETVYAGEEFSDEPEEEFLPQDDFEIPTTGRVPFQPEFVEEAVEETIMQEETEYREDPGFIDQAVFEDAPMEEDIPPVPAEPQVRPKKERRERKPVKPAGPNVFTKFYDLYFAPVLNKGIPEEPQDPTNPRRRRRKSKIQIFKEVYLPAIIVCVCMVLVFTFLIGSVVNFVKQRKIDAETEQSRIEATKDAQAEAAAAQQRALAKAADLAAMYDYEGALEALESIGDMTQYPDISAKHAEYLQIQGQLVEHQDPSLIPNLSFHPLIVDLPRALRDEELGGKYNRNFVSTAEFSKILDQLYANNYVLVDFSSFTENVDGQIHTKSIFLPQGKKPLMLTETLVNYFEYMIDGNGDGEADAGGAGFAHKLVLDASGDIKAEYVDSAGNKLVGDYDLVPILESFLKEHPDFSYRGARAILAVTGSQGIFGYRINSSYIANKSQTYQQEQVAGAQKIVSALRGKGYTLACNTFGNGKYADFNTNQITQDLQKWTQDITPVIGEVDVFVFAQESNLTDYGGSSFNVMHTSGYRYFVSSAGTPLTEVNTSYVRQNRLMVTGNTMAWKSDQFTGIFDPNVVIDLATRGNVPN